MRTDGENALGSITEEKEETGNGGGGGKDGSGTVSGKDGPGDAPPRRSLPKMAVSFGKKTRERLKTTKSRLVNGSEEQPMTDEINQDIGTTTGDEIIEQVRTMQVSSV